MKQLLYIIGTSVLLYGCTSHKIESKSELDVKPIEIKPIHITIDINVKVDRALDNFFGDLDQEADQVKPSK
ncbi:hypothetical protein P0136_10955 [Lentisphaerota bacterium ZTH]|nr:hypothetical protein JYG24_11525 [Lentisphaerota bacterium]WET05880.1 hypothetical protein P0136_10955 [Lentisphaerota bacterium ZTH]